MNNESPKDYSVLRKGTDRDLVRAELIGTLGVSEAITNPVEASVGKDKIRLRVCYIDNRVDVLERLEIGKDPVLLEDPHQI